MANAENSDKIKNKRSFLANKEKMKKVFSVFLAFQMPLTYSLVSATAENYQKKNNNSEKINLKILSRKLKHLNFSKKNNQNNLKIYSFLAGAGLGTISGVVLKHLARNEKFDEIKANTFLISLMELIFSKNQNPERFKKAREIVSQSGFNNTSKNNFLNMIETIQAAQEEKIKLQNENENKILELNNQIQTFKEENLKQKESNDEIRKLKQQVEELNNQIQVSNEEKEELTLSLQKQSEELKNQNKNIEELNNQIQTFKEENLEQQVEELNKQIQQSLNQIESLKNEKQKLKNQIQNQDSGDQNEILSKEIQQLKDQIESQNLEIYDDIEKMSNGLKGFFSAESLNSIKEEIQKLEKKFSEFEPGNEKINAGFELIYKLAECLRNEKNYCINQLTQFYARNQELENELVSFTEQNQVYLQKLEEYIASPSSANNLQYEADRLRFLFLSHFSNLHQAQIIHDFFSSTLNDENDFEEFF
ncbi:MAG: hypothetical protein LBJ32_03255 [Oscillospiraceae bacterium]|jgi:chromosome segregation ATPase|nr:hypothetical protein [Oscillospiraceae bacterium]